MTAPCAATDSSEESLKALGITDEEWLQTKATIDAAKHPRMGTNPRSISRISSEYSSESQCKSCSSYL